MGNSFWQSDPFNADRKWSLRQQREERKLHQKFAGGIEAIAAKHPHAVAGPYGVGGMVAFTPYDGSAEKAKEMVNRLYDAGLMSFMAGREPSRLRFLMPIGCVEDHHIETACEIIEQVVVEMS